LATVTTTSAVSPGSRRPFPDAPSLTVNPAKSRFGEETMMANEEDHESCPTA